MVLECDIFIFYFLWLYLALELFVKIVGKNNIDWFGMLKDR